MLMTLAHHKSNSNKENTDSSNILDREKEGRTMSAFQPAATSVLESSPVEGHYSNATSRIKQARRIVNKRSVNAPPFVVSPPPSVAAVAVAAPKPRRIGKHHNNSCYFSSDSSDYSISAAAPRSKDTSQKEGSSSSAVEPEVFLRNPRTGGFDYTPAQREYQQHANQSKGRYDTNKRDVSSARNSNNNNNNIRTLDDLLEGHENNRNNNYADTDTLNDSDVYTTFSKPVPAVIQSKSPPKATSTNKPKHLFSSLRGSKQKKPSKLKSIGSVVEQLKCRVTGSPPRTINTTYQQQHNGIIKNDDKDDQSSSGFLQYGRQEIDDNEVQTAVAKDQHHGKGCRPPHPITSGAVLVTPPRSGQSPGKRSRHNNDRDLSGISSLEFSLMDQDRHEEEDEAEELESIPEEDDDDDNTSVESSSEAVSAPSFVQGSDIVSLAGPTPLNPSCASDSSCLDLSFSTMGKQSKVNESVWTFQAVSPVLASCGRDTTTNSSYHYTYHKNDSDIDSESDDSVVEPLRRRILHQDSGFDADIEKTREDDETATLDFSIMNPESLSFHSGGAILLTEEGLKRHNDKKLQQPTVEPLVLRQPNGVGKLEKVVLHQKVQRLQDKELKNQADASLDEEVAARKRRLKKPAVNGGGMAQNLDQDDPAGISQVSVTPEKSPKPAMSPTSMSPQTSVGAVASPSSFEKDVFPKKSWFKRIMSKNKSKKATKNKTEELKEQWKEKERKRVELARLEKEEEERFERERIQALRQSFLEKQRQLEAAATMERQGKAQIVDVDELIAANTSMETNEEHFYNDDNALSSTSNSTDPSVSTGSRRDELFGGASHRISTQC